MRIYLSISFMLSMAFAALPALSNADQPCGNNTPTGPSGPSQPQGGDPISIYTGNEYRLNHDLVVYGGVGQHQLSFDRSVNTRYTTGANPFGTYGMRHGYQWEMADVGFDTSSSPLPLVTLCYPDGSVNTFKDTSYYTSAVTHVWRSAISIEDILYSTGNSFTLQRKNGYKYYFSRLTDTSSSIYYQCTGFADAQQALYSFSYDVNNRLIQITEPAGRFLKITYADTIANPEAFHTLASISTQPGAAQWTALTVSDPTPYRYLRYVGPDGTRCEVGEIQFYTSTSSTPLSGTAFGSSPSLYAGNEFGKAFDNNTATYFANKATVGGFTGIDLGAGNEKAISQVKFYPHDPSKMISPSWHDNGYFQGSNQAPHVISVISKVESSDGRAVTYNYTSQSDASISLSYTLLSSVTYEDSTLAQYTYVQLFPATRPIVETSNEPRNRLPYSRTKNQYFTGLLEALGEVQYQKNLVTGEALTTITTGYSAHFPKVVYPNGGSITYSMATGLSTSEVDGLGNTTNTSRSSSTGFQTGETDALGRVISRTYSAYNNTLSLTYPGSVKVTYTRDANDQVLTHKDERGYITTYTRDTQGRVTRKTYPDASYESWTYNSFNEVLTHTQANGGVLSYTYDTRGLRTSTTDATGAVTTYTYDSRDQLASSTNALGKTTQYNYNSLGQVTKITHPDSSYVSYEYDLYGNVVKSTDELNHSWLVTYDAIRRITSTSDPLARTTTYAYPDAASTKPSLVTLPSGKKTAYTYDLNGRVLTQTLGYGSTDAATTSYTYDAVGNVVVTTDAKGYLSNYTYDTRNRILTSKDPLGNISSVSYDAAGNQLTRTRPDGGVTSNIFDVMNRITKTTDPAGHATAYTYNVMGSRTSLTDAKSHTYSDTYDAMNRHTSTHYPDASVEQWSYDVLGRVSTLTTRKGPVCTYTYDNRDRNTAYSWSDSTPGSTRTYDAASRLLTNANGVATLSYSYDVANQCLSETTTIAGLSPHIASHLYDADGNRAQLTNPDGTVIAYSYTGRNQVASVSADGPPPMAVYTYDANGNRLTKTLENGTVATYAYDAANRLTSLNQGISGTTIVNHSYSLNAVGNRTARSETTATGTTTDHYTYDAIDQVTDVSYAAGRTVGYNYDAVGNRTSVTDAGVSTIYATNSLNQYQTVGGSTQGYDANGNLTASNGWSYVYDAQNRLISAGNSTTLETFAYDSRNRCVSRVLNGTASYYAYDGWEMIAEYDASGIEQTSYIHGPGTDEILSKVTSAGAVYYHQDGNNNVVALSSDDGNVVERYTYDVFGTASIFNGSGISVAASAYSNHFLFTGREYLSEIGLYDYRNRVYSATFGRFLQMDPIRFNGGDVNIYRYCLNAPIYGGDPMGLFEIGSAASELQTALREAAAAVSESAASAGEILSAGAGMSTAGTVGVILALTTGNIDSNGSEADWEYHNSHQDPTSDDSDTPDDSPSTPDEPSSQPEAPPENNPSKPSTKNPNVGEPDSESTCPNRKGNPGQTRRYGPDGNPQTDSDWDHWHDGLPPGHAHDWEPDPDGGYPTRQPGRPMQPGDPQIPPNWPN